MEITAIPDISAKSWVVLDGNTKQLLHGKYEDIPREIASLTKIMTAYTVLKLVEEYSININSEIITADPESVLTMGTTAGLLNGDQVTIYDMLHALLLPSGNDAAGVLAQYFGKLLGIKSSHTNPLSLFIARMNENAIRLSLTKTNFNNPHGLCDKDNISSAFDIGILTVECMNNKIFSEIVCKHKYTCQGISAKGEVRMFEWYQTNRLLWKGFNGVKTGTTVTAGRCLSASYKEERIYLIIVVLGCKNEYHRWEDVVKLKDFFNKKATSSIAKKNVKRSYTK